jgi:ribosome-binding protein aMBF1 (putative translation factor)
MTGGIDVKKKQQKRLTNSVRSPKEYTGNPLVTAFAMRMKAWRQEKGLTLKVVASKTGLSMAILCEWEHANRFPSVDHLWAIAEYTGIPAWELIRPLKGAGKRR